MIHTGIDLLTFLGRHLDFRPHGLGAWRTALDLKMAGMSAASVREVLITSWLKVRNKRGRLVRLRANRAQREYEQRCSERNIILKARQMGMTTWVAARFFIHTITRPGTLSVQVAHDQRSAEEIFRIVHRFLENLPATVRQGALNPSRVNVRQIVFPSLDSEYRVETAADPNAGRGLTIQNLHCSEVARWPRDGAETLASLRAAVPPGGEVVLESTPSGAGGCFYEEWQNAHQAGYTRHFFPWWWDAGYVEDAAELNELQEDEQELAEQHGLTREQMAYRRKIRASLRGLAAQEFAEDATSCFLESGECVFDVPTLKKMLAESCPPVEERDNHRVLVWFPPQKTHEYIIGVDPAGGGSEGDYACAQVIDRQTGMQCAELVGHLGPQELARRVAELGKEYNHALLAVERNNHGFGVLAHLTAGERYENLYMHGEQPGWLTTAVTRPAMIENLAMVVATAPVLFHSQRFIEQCRTFVRLPEGSPGAAQGAHDDCVLAMAIAFAVRQERAGDLARERTFDMTCLPVG